MTMPTPTAGTGAPAAGGSAAVREARSGPELQIGQRREKVAYGSHICQLFNQRSEAFGVMLSLLRSGLHDGERCIMLASEPTFGAIRPKLAEHFPDLAEREEQGQITFFTQKDPFLVKGKFDPYYLVSAHQTQIGQALKEGWPAIRIGVDMSWLTRGLATTKDILKYEATCDAVFTFQNTPIVALAQYDYGRLSGSLVVELLKLHPIAIVGNFIKRNPYYHNSEEYLRRILHIERDRRQISL